MLPYDHPAEPEPHGRLTADAPAPVAADEGLAFERLLGELSALFANVPAGREVAEIANALGRLRAFLGFDRCSFGEFDGDQGCVSVLCSAVRPGLEPTPIGPGPRLPWFFRQLQAGRLLAFARLPDELPPVATEEIAYCRRLGIRSNLSIPLRVTGRIIGVIAFSAFRPARAWPEGLIIRLKVLGELFAQALIRGRRDAELAAALAEVARLAAEPPPLREPTGLPVLTSRSARFNQLLDEIAQVAPTRATVLLLGETGTGKEVLADAIHASSDRRQRPLIKVNCAALPASLMEAELFGREKGAYTGALTRQAGRFELADGGTLFLDEIGELPLESQTRLLRVIEDGRFERVGGNRTLRVDVRLIAATNRDLAAAVAAGQFRSDLYYRLNVFPITVPPLRERPEDIPVLARAFLQHFGQALGKPVADLAPAALEAMLAYPWPGNVRELRNVVERAVILCRGPTLQLHWAAPAEPAAPAPVIPTPPAGGGDTLAEWERAHLLQVLTETGWRIRGPGGAAARLAVKPTTLESRMKRLGLRRPGG